MARFMGSLVLVLVGGQGSIPLSSHLDVQWKWNAPRGLFPWSRVGSWSIGFGVKPWHSWYLDFLMDWEKMDLLWKERITVFKLDHQLDWLATGDLINPSSREEEVPMLFSILHSAMLIYYWIQVVLSLMFHSYISMNVKLQWLSFHASFNKRHQPWKGKSMVRICTTFLRDSRMESMSTC